MLGLSSNAWEMIALAFVFWVLVTCIFAFPPRSRGDD